jgi:hypothetical protein
MDLSKYQELTGITVSASRAVYVQAQINRSIAMLETLLGFTLDPENVDTNLYNEVGKARTECACPSVDTEDLDDPDEVIGAYRMFPYNTLDQFLHVDPFTKLHAVKLVFVKQGASGDGVTLRTFNDERVRVHQGRDGIAKYIELCRDCFCDCGCDGCVQLAVDADWLWEGELPNDLLYVLADMVTYYSDQKRNVKSESITTHSYTKFDRVAPETEPQNLAVIQRYAGPLGSATVMPTNGAAGRRVGPWVSY